MTPPHPPTLQRLVALGYTPLSHRDALHHRGGRLRNVLLDDILADRLLVINRFSYRGRRYRFDLEDAHEAIRRLHPTPDQVQGLRRTNQEIYDLLVLGTTITQRIAGDFRSYPFRYIDWDDPTNNVYHVTAGMEVECRGSFRTRCLDVVAFVNGIPFIVIKDNRATESGREAGTRLIAYQSRENIPHFFHFAQLLLALNGQEARYATVGTAKKFWHGWREPNQAHTVHALCRPDLVRRFTVFDAGIRKIARHHQFFAVRRAIDHVKHIDPDGKRQGGAIWHTHGSGKSLTMLMLGRALALDNDIVNPRIILVTDRADLDHQIRDTFKSCDLVPIRARSGRHLITLIRDRTPLVTTLVNKFDTALRYSGKPDDDPNLFVLVDESRRCRAEIVISEPDDREGQEEVDKASKDRVRVFWAEAMERYGSETEYNRRVIGAFKGPATPEILIVVSKLLTGFDAPRNTVLYVCKPLKEHNLLQAIARVNRLHEEGETEKKFGFIIDYQGLLGELDSALTTYSALEGYDPEDLVGAVLDVREEIRKLRHYHGRLWDLFRPVRNKKDMEAMEQFLADEARSRRNRNHFRLQG